MTTCQKCGAVYDGAEMFCPKDGTRLATTREGRALKSVPPEPDPFIGKVIQGRYRVLDQLGEGGMGVVYVAEHVEIEKKVALKILRDDFSKRPEVVERFRQEARSASKIGHPHIVDVTDFGQTESGGVFFVMEHLQGRGLSDLLRGQTIPVVRAVPIVTQIARALQAAHKLGIVHRDLKPENIFLVERDGQEDFVKVLDFGIAKISDRDSDGQRLTKTGMIFGTPEYMSPEQASGKPLDHRVDVYALGCIMFEMFVGTVPFDGDSFMAVLTQHMFEPIPIIEMVNPYTDVPQSVCRVVYKAMAKNKEDRYADMAELESDLNRALDDAGDGSAHTGQTGSVHQQDPLPLISAGSSAQPVASGDTRMDWADSADTFSTPQKKKKNLLAAVVIGLFALAAGVAYLFGFGDIDHNTADVSIAVPAASQFDTPKPAVTPASPAPTPADANDTVKASPGPQPAEAHAGSDVVGQKEKILVSITSEPKGAVISVQGMGQICSTAPCDVALEAGLPVEIEAKLKHRRAKMTFTPSEQNKAITLELKRSRPIYRPHKNKSGKQGQSDVSELKIPGIFKDN
ncbi:MAG: protein kinase [Myxococcota bacterium]|nr:protein kinase [Myxococcota bacterium]